MTVKPAQFDLLTQLLTLSETRHRVVSQNVANVNTPGYRRLEVSFEDTVRELLANKSSSDLSGIEPVVRPQGGLPVRGDGNDVDIDREMGELNKNALMYQTLTQVLASRMGTMRSAITGR